MKILTLRVHRLHSSTGRWLWRVAGVGLGAWLLLAAAAAVVRAEGNLEPRPGASPGDQDGAAERWISIGMLSGATLHDGALDDYQWSTSPESGRGAQALAGFGRLATGLRVWSATTEQSVGTSDPATAQVRVTSLEAVGQAHLARLAGAELAAVASLGWLHLGYHPDQVTVSSGTGTPIVVDLAPIDEWIAGGGFAIKRRLGENWGLGLEVDRRFFGLDTAHRDGGTIVERRERFGDWSMHLELSRLIAW